MVFITNQGQVFKRNIENNTYTKITHNSAKRIFDPTDVLIDGNQDIWVTTRTSGVFRISLEPFTVINHHPIYQNSLIRFVAHTKGNDIVITIGNEGTFITPKGEREDFTKNEKIFVTSITHIGDTALLSTNKGIDRKSTRLNSSHVRISYAVFC